MKQNKKTIWIALALAITLWLAAPIISMYPSFVYSHLSSECKVESDSPSLPTSTKADKCAAFMAIQGQAGDLFGATTSVFSGLALFAVAFTLYADLTHRRRERKPLIACNVDNENYLNFDKPSADAEPKTFYIRGKISVSSISETAINVAVRPTLIIKNIKHCLDPIYIGIPMEGGRSHSVELSDLLNKATIDAICENPQQLAPITLKFETICSNLEGERFKSEVSYKVSLRFPDNLSKIMSIRHSGIGIDGTWDDRSAMPLDCKLEPNSWKFSLAEN